MSKFHLFGLVKLPFSQDLLDSVVFGSVHPEWSEFAPFLGATVDTKLDFVRMMRDRAEKAEAAQWRVLNHARQRSGASPATLSIVFMLYVLSVMTYGSELWIFQLKRNYSHTASVRAKYRANWNRMNRVYMNCARRILGAPARTSSDAVLVRLGWMPLYQLLVFRALIWFVKGSKGLAGPALQNLISDMRNGNAKMWTVSRFFKPASETLSLLSQLDADSSDFFSLPIPNLKSKLRDLIFIDLTDSWKLSPHAHITHIIHPQWRPRKLPRSMHSRFSHVMYNCLAVNRAPFRSWLYKIKRAKTEMCRFGCHCIEDADHVLFNCNYINDERQDLKDLCLKENLDFSLKNIMTHPSQQISTVRLLLTFFTSSK